MSGPVSNRGDWLVYTCISMVSFLVQGQFMDIIAFNRYYGWYYNPGLLGTITGDMETEIEARYAAHHKPVMITEYGAGAIDGIHRVGGGGGEKHARFEAHHKLWTHCRPIYKVFNLVGHFVLAIQGLLDCCTFVMQIMS